MALALKKTQISFDAELVDSYTKGQKIGEARGEVRGEAKKALEIANNLFNEGDSIEKVARVTNLSVETLKKTLQLQ